MRSWLDEDSALSSEPESSDTESNFGKCRRTGASSRAPKPYSKSGNKPWTPEADDELRRCVRAPVPAKRRSFQRPGTSADSPARARRSLVATTPLLPTGKRDWTYMAKQLSKKVTVKRSAKQVRRFACAQLVPRALTQAPTLCRFASAVSGTITMHGRA